MLNLALNKIKNSIIQSNHMIQLAKRIEAQLIQKSDLEIENFFIEIIDKAYLKTAYSVDDKKINKIFKVINENLTKHKFFFINNKDKILVIRKIEREYKCK